MPPEVSVVVMAFNEATTLREVVEEIASELRQHDVPYEIIIVNDGSRDDTEAIAESLVHANLGVSVVRHAVNRGLGGVYRTGFAEARGTYLTFFPADGQFPASIIGHFLRVIGDCDLVLGYLPTRSGSLLPRLLSRLERLLYRCLFGPLPPFQGVFMLRRDILHDVALQSVGRGWAIVMELIVRASRGGYRLVSVPTALRPRRSGRSKVNNVRTLWANVAQVVALRRTFARIPDPAPGAFHARRSTVVRDRSGL